MHFKLTSKLIKMFIVKKNSRPKSTLSRRSKKNETQKPTKSPYGALGDITMTTINGGTITASSTKQNDVLKNLKKLSKKVSCGIILYFF